MILKQVIGLIMVLIPNVFIFKICCNDLGLRIAFLIHFAIAAGILFIYVGLRLFMGLL